MPGAVPPTSTYALTNVTLPYLVELAVHGATEALPPRPGAGPRRQHRGRPGRQRGRWPRPLGPCRPARPSHRRRLDAATARRPSLDDIDKAIIRALQVDGRTPYAKLGPAVGLSQAAVRQRVQRLIDRGVMQVVAVTDPPRSGSPCRP